MIKFVEFNYMKNNSVSKGFVILREDEPIDKLISEKYGVREFNLLHESDKLLNKIRLTDLTAKEMLLLLEYRKEMDTKEKTE